jgi:hypothetical protein
MFSLSGSWFSTEFDQDALSLKNMNSHCEHRQMWSGNSSYTLRKMGRHIMYPEVLLLSRSHQSIMRLSVLQSWRVADSTSKTHIGTMSDATQTQIFTQQGKFFWKVWPWSKLWNCSTRAYLNDLRWDFFIGETETSDYHCRRKMNDHRSRVNYCMCPLLPCSSTLVNV